MVGSCRLDEAADAAVVVLVPDHQLSLFSRTTFVEHFSICSMRITLIHMAFGIAILQD
jgi:hypothetical protein